MSRKLDAAIADAQGYEVVYAKTYERGEIRENRNMPGLKIYDDCRMGCPCYSSDAYAMLELDRAMKERGWALTIKRERYPDSFNELYNVEYSRTYMDIYYEVNTETYEASANTLPLAVALAAYKALTGKDWKE